MKYKVLALIILTSQLAFAQQKPKLPFVFLNQYFEYDASDANKITFGQSVYNWNDKFFTLTQESDKIHIQTKKQPLFNKGKWSIQLIDKNKVVFKKTDFSDFSYLAEINLDKSSEHVLDQVCIQSMNKISQLVICYLADDSNTAQNNAQVIPEVFIANKKTDSVGRVVLNSAKEPITTVFQVGQQGSVVLTTRKRNIIPSEIEKDASKKNYTIKFIDLAQKNESWEDEVTYEQESFKIPFDDLLIAKQDYFNKDNSAKDLSLTYYVPPFVKTKIDNIYSLTPFLGFSKLDGNTQTERVALLSSFDFGFRYYTSQLIKPDLKFLDFFDYWTAALNIRSVSYIPSVNSFKVANNKQLLYGANASLNKKYNDNLGYGVLFNIEKNVSLDLVNPAANTVALNSLLNIDLGAHVNYVLFDKGRFTSILQPGFLFILPAKVSGSSSSIGTQYFTRLDLHYADKNKLYGFGVNYSLRSQDTAAQKIKDQVFDYTASYSIVF